MMRNFTLTMIAVLLFSGALVAQRPAGPPGPPAGRPIRGGMPEQQPPGEHRPNGEWIKPFDSNGNDILDAEEFSAALEMYFGRLDRNGDGRLDAREVSRRPPQPMGAPDGPGPRPQEAMLPPFLFLDRVGPGKEYGREEFEKIARSVFAEMDGNGDGNLSRDEARRLPRRPGGPPPPPSGQPPPNARFVGAALRFGDRLVKGQPIQAEIVMENTRRLFDGSTVTKTTRGAIYRDSEGRTRREQPLEIAGIEVTGQDGKPQSLVFINDFASRTHLFLDPATKIARRMPLGPGPGELKEPNDGRRESLGTKTIEGVSVEGTRITFEIPAGRIGNGKPLQAVTERWYSKDLDMVVMSRHVDPIDGEHVFRLVNIRRSDPPPALFSIPAGYRVENEGNRRPNE